MEILLFYPTNLFRRPFPSFLQHPMLPAWSLFPVYMPFVPPTPPSALSPTASSEQPATAGPSLDLHTLGALTACMGTTVTEEEKWGAEAGGNAVLQHPSLPAAGEGQLRGGAFPSIQITARTILRSWEGKTRATVFLAIFPPASSLSSFPAVGHQSRLDVACPE